MKPIVTDKQIVIIGLGKTGLSCARYLSQFGHKITIMDTRDAPPGLLELKKEFPEIMTVFGDFDRKLLCAADEIILSPGVALANDDIQAAIAAGVSVRGDIDIFSKVAKAPIIAITGSNGKSTVTTLVGEMAIQAGINVGVGGNLGTPALDLLSDDKQLYVLELSSFQLETTESLNAMCVVILNVSEDHMDRYPNKLAYLQAKQRIFRGAKTVVVNDDEMLSYPLVTTNMNLVHYGLSSPDLKKFSISEHHHERYLVHGFDDLLPVKELRIKGGHNLSNALAALAIGSVAGIPASAMIAALKTYRGLPHRCQWIKTVNGVDYINDSKGTNPIATSTAISSFGREISGKVILIAGGVSKEADMSPLKSPMKRFGKVAILIGTDAEKIQAVLQSVVEVRNADNLQHALTLANKIAKPGDVVILSPACASFDMFDSYVARGEEFEKGVACL